MLKKLLSQTAIYGISSILGRALNLLLTPFYTKLLAEGAFGQISDVFSWTSMLSVLIMFGMETTFFRYMREQKEQGKDTYKVYHHAFLVVGILSLSVMVLGILFSQPISYLLEYDDIALAVPMIAGILFLDNMSNLPMARLRYEEKAKHFAFINLVNILLTLGLNIYFLQVAGKGIEYIFISNLIASAVRFVMAVAFVKGDIFVWEKPDKALMNDMLRYGFFIMLAGLAGMQNENLDKILLKRMWIDGTLYHGIARSGKDMLGIYSAGYKLGIFISLVIQAFRYAAEPFFFKQSGKKESPALFARIFHFFMLACLACFLWVSAFMHEIVSIKIFGYNFIDKKFWEGLEVVPIVLMAYVFAAAFSQFTIWFKLTKQTHYALYFTGTGALLTVILNVLTIPTWGYIGCAWATLICYLIMAILVYFVGQKHYPIPYNIPILIVYTLLVIGAYLACDWVGHEGWHAIGSKIGICVAVMGGIALWEYKKEKGVL
jgi:O-antigen/teichoic acid export membrane protein